MFLIDISIRKIYSPAFCCILLNPLSTIFLQAVLNLQVPVEHSKEVNDCKHLIKTLIMGNKFSFAIIFFLN